MADSDLGNNDNAEPADEAAGTGDTINKERGAEANSIITKYAAFAFGGGVIPFPLMDIAAVSGIQMKMLADIAKLYEVEFIENWGKSTLTALLGGVVPHVLAFGTVGSLVKAIPVLGSAVGFATMPLLSAATTYAVGKVFVQHFESGGTFLDFDSETAKDVFKEHYAKGKELYKRQAQALKKKRAARAAAKSGIIDLEAEEVVISDPAPESTPAESASSESAPTESSKTETKADAPIASADVDQAASLVAEETTVLDVPIRRRSRKSAAPTSSV